MINVNKFGKMGVQKGHRRFTIPWGANKDQSGSNLKDISDAVQVLETTKDIVSSHAVARTPDYIRHARKGPMWSEDLDPSRSNDVRTLEMGGNTYRSQVTSEPAPRVHGLPQGYHKTSFRLSDDAGNIEVKASFEDGKIKSSTSLRRLEDGSTESVSFKLNDNGTLTYESSWI